MSRRLIAVFVVVGVLGAGGALFFWRDRVTASAGTRPAATGSTDPQARAVVSIDARRQQLLGVRTVRATKERLPERIRTVGAVAYDETRMVDVNAKVEGWIRELYVNYSGQAVKKDQPLFTLYSPDLIAAQTQLIAAALNRDLVSPQLAAEQRTYLDRLVETPRMRLQRWDVPLDQIETVERTRELLEAVVFRSPASGVVIEKAALKGMRVEPGATLYRVADVSAVWVEAAFYEADIARLRVGQAATVTLDAWRGMTFTGRIIHVYPYMSEQTRTVKARIELSNQEGRLKPGMFATVDVSVGASEGVVVPIDAVVDSGSRQMVFVAQGEGRFEPRQVTVGARDEGRVQILSGLRESEEVAVRATFLLDSESQMRAALENYQPAVSPTRSPTQAAPRSADLSLRSTPDPPKAGENVFEVTMQNADGHPMSDADEVQVLFYMPAMPTMNMPAMRSEARLTSVGPGLYRGSGTLPMPGRWDVTVTANRHGQPIGVKQATVIAR